jgi:hypothetical protein
MSQPERSTGTGEAGYFLTDALVGLFVVASVAGSLLGAFGLARSTADRAEQASKALVIARSCIEENSLEAGSHQFTVDGVDYRQVRLVEALEMGKEDVVELVRVSCATQWTERSSPREVRLKRLETRAKKS